MLVDQFNDESPGVAERIKYLYCLDFPPLFKLRKELGESFLRVGSIKSALALFEKLDMWDEIVQCYIMMEKDKTVNFIFLK